MAERGCFLVPTLSAMRDCLRWAKEGALTPTQCKKILDFSLDIGECVQIAKEYGVPLASGTDYISREQHGRNLEELTLMHQAGLTVEETLLAATAGGAELCGVEDDRGRIARGLRVRRDRARRRSWRPLGLCGARRRDRRLPGGACRPCLMRCRSEALCERPARRVRGVSKRSAACRRSPTSTSTIDRARSTRSSARTAPASRRSARSSPACTGPTTGELLRRRRGRSSSARRATRSPTGITIDRPGADARPAALGASRTCFWASRRARPASSTPRDVRAASTSSSSEPASSSPPRRLVADAARSAEQQKVEILRAIARDARLIVMDEPTAALTRDETERLFELDPARCATAARRSSTSRTSSTRC